MNVEDVIVAYMERVRGDINRLVEQINGLEAHLNEVQNLLTERVEEACCAGEECKEDSNKLENPLKDQSQR